MRGADFRKWTVTAAAAFCLWLLLLKPASSQAATLNVPLDYSTIQSAINEAADGDTVLVSNGTYTENINFYGKAITVRSVNGATSTIIDGNNNGSVVTFANSELYSVILDGFTLINGNGTDTTYECKESTAGGGIYCIGFSSPTITNCTIRSNTAGYGGGIYCGYFSSPIIINCTISGNSASGGGGISCKYRSSPDITNCTISGNYASGGGGIYCFYSSSPAITDCVINGNSACKGGGIYIGWCYSHSPAITNCVISGNSAGDWGGGIVCIYSSPTTTNCTISSNSAKYGGGIHVASPSSCPKVLNCILWGNSASKEGSEIYVPCSPGGCGSITITHSDIKGGHAGTGNINSNPLFSNAAMGDFRLQTGSRCVDTGTAHKAPDTDIDSNPRPLDTKHCTMGAYEYISVPFTPARISYPPKNCSGNFKVTWSPAVRAVSYVLQRSEDGIDFNDVITTSKCSYNETVAYAGTYYYRMRAENSYGPGGWRTGPAVWVGQPDNPANLTYPSSICSPSNPTFTVIWSASNRAINYTLKRATDSSFIHSTIVYHGSGTSHRQKLAPGTYYFKVRANNTCWRSDWAIGSAITVNSVAPASISYSVITSKTLTVNWPQVTGADSYTLEQAADSNFTQHIQTYSNITNTYYPVSGLSKGTTYYYRVQAVNGCGNSKWRKGKTVGTKK